jgi:hypothetical protein
VAAGALGCVISAGGYHSQRPRLAPVLASGGLSNGRVGQKECVRLLRERLRVPNSEERFPRDSFLAPLESRTWAAVPVPWEDYVIRHPGIRSSLSLR